MKQKLDADIIMEENIVKKGENAGLPAFSPFSIMFAKDLPSQDW